MRFVQIRHRLACVIIGLVLLPGGSWLVARQKQPSVGQKEAVFEVRWSGALKNVMMKGDLKGTIDLRALTELPHVYAVGALEGLQGEVTVLNSAASIARVQDGKVVLSQVAEGKACVLVYAQVQQWKDIPLPKTTKSLGQLESFVVEAAKREGMNVNRPFPFLVKGTLAEATYHVVRHPGDLKDHQDLHDKAKVKYTFKGGAVELVGFYSDKHLGIFTCGGNLHVHMRSADGKLSGHLDEVDLGDTMRLFLPTAPAK
jgi:acetolactate decarboxylase